MKHDRSLTATLVFTTSILLSACSGGGGGTAATSTAATSTAATSTPVATVQEASATDTPTIGIPSALNVSNLRLQREQWFKDYVTRIQTQYPSYTFTGANINFDYAKIDVDGLEQAHQNGWSGKGVRLRILDSLSSDSDTEFVEFNNTTQTVDFKHGAKVSSIAMAIAPEADIVVQQRGGTLAKIIDPTVSGVNSSYGVDINNYANDDPVINYVKGTMNDVGIHNPNAVIVHSAGNNGADSNGAERGCVAYGGRWSADTCGELKYVTNSTYYDHLDRFIDVGIYDPNTQTLAFYSVSAGPVGKDHFLVANGTGIITNGIGGSYAAPRVTGAVALVKHKFPDQTAQQIKQTLLRSAIDLGEPGVDPVFGHGLLSVGRALNPIGQLH